MDLPRRAQDPMSEADVDRQVFMLARSLELPVAVLTTQRLRPHKRPMLANNYWQRLYAQKEAP